MGQGFAPTQQSCSRCTPPGIATAYNQGMIRMQYSIHTLQPLPVAGASAFASICITKTTTIKG